jgi:hypothetical protein
LKKRSKKLLTFQFGAWGSTVPNSQKFFASFFQKSRLLPAGQTSAPALSAALHSSNAGDGMPTHVTPAAIGPAR